MDNDEYIEYLVNTYADTVLRVSFSYLKNIEDAKDIVQTVFVKLCTMDKKFKDKEHEKAFILRVTINVCKDVLKSSWRRNTCDIDNCKELVADNDDKDNEMIVVVNQLEDKYRIVIYLHYYEGYKASEIGKIIGIPTATVHTRLVRGRDKLKKILEGENYGTIQG